MNIPPKSLKRQLVQNVEPTAGTFPTEDGPRLSSGRKGNAQIPTMRKASELADAAAVSADSLPVLQAFQDFLESERKHARRQIMTVTSFFLLLFLIITGAGAFFGYVYFEKMNNEIVFLHSELSRSKSTMSIETKKRLSGLADRTDALSTRIVDGDVLIKQATAEISSTFSNSMTASFAELDQIRNSLAALQKENRSLRHDLATINITPPATSPSMEMASSSSSYPSETSTSLPAVRKVPKPPTSSALSPLEIGILAPGSSNAMKWRIPIWE
jgi:cell division protein FtsB